AQSELEKSNIWTRKDLAVADQQALQARGLKEIGTDRDAEKQSLWGRKIKEGGRFAGGVTRAVGDGIGDAAASGSSTAGALIKGGGRLAGGTFEVAGGGADLYLQYRSIENRAAGKMAALNGYTNQSINNQGAAAVRFDQAQDRYRERMKVATVERAAA